MSESQHMAKDRQIYLYYKTQQERRQSSECRERGETRGIQAGGKGSRGGTANRGHAPPSAQVHYYRKAPLVPPFSAELHTYVTREAACSM